MHPCMLLFRTCTRELSLQSVSTVEAAQNTVVGLDTHHCTDT